MKTPTWGDIEEFCRKDGWDHIRNTGHTFFRKVREDGTVLETHASRSSKKGMSSGHFVLILRDQLRVSPDEFWETLRTGNRAKRPSPAVMVTSPALPAWLVWALLHETQLSEEEIGGMDLASAKEILERQRTSLRE